MFTTVVDSSRMSDCEKMAHLQNSLSGAAKNAIQGFGFNGNLYAEAIEELRRRYGNPRIIVDAHLNRLISSKTPTFREPGTIIDKVVLDVQSSRP